MGQVQKIELTRVAEKRQGARESEYSPIAASTYRAKKKLETSQVPSATWRNERDTSAADETSTYTRFCLDIKCRATVAEDSVTSAIHEGS